MNCAIFYGNYISFDSANRRIFTKVQLTLKGYMENAALLNALVHNAMDGTITMDEFGTIETINATACKLFGYLAQEVLGLNIAILMPNQEEVPLGHNGTYDKTTTQAQIKSRGSEIMGTTKKGLRFPFTMGIIELSHSGRKIYAGCIHDLTPQKEEVERLKNYAANVEVLVEQRTKTLKDTIKTIEKSKEKVMASLAKEKTVSNLKNRFLAMASHEFRSPLSAAHLSASLIEQYAESQDKVNITKHAGKIINAITNLTAVLNDFLFIEQIEIGKVKSNKSCFDLVQLASEISEDMQMQAKEEQQIHFHHSGSSTWVTLDQNLLKNSIINLMTNAIKYSGEKSCIKLTTTIDRTHCIITVKDEGIGIPVDEQKHLFEPFFRAHNTGTIPGTGLGLTIVARYIELMKGTIVCRSAQGQGTLFTLTFSLI